MSGEGWGGGGGVGVVLEPRIGGGVGRIGLSFVIIVYIHCVMATTYVF